MFNTNPNPFWFIIMLLFTVFVVILSCANVAHSHEYNNHRHQHDQYSRFYYDTDYQYRYHVPKRIRFHEREVFYVEFNICRIHHKRHVCRERHGYDFRYGDERPLTPRERYMRNKVIREGGEW